MNVIFVVYFVVIGAVFFIYIKKYMQEYLDSMVEFHDFLNNYR